MDVLSTLGRWGQDPGGAIFPVGTRNEPRAAGDITPGEGAVIIR